MRSRSGWFAIVSTIVLSTGCFEEEKPFKCAAWCAADASDVVYATYSAVDEADAQSQCFANYNCSDMPGRLLKCTCDPL